MPTAVIERMKFTKAGLLAGDDSVPEVKEPKIKPVYNKSQLKPEGRAEAQAKACNPKRAAKAHGGPGPVKEPGSHPWRPPIPDTVDPKRVPVRIDTRQQPAPKPTVERIRVSTKPEPTRATDAGLMPKTMPRMTQPKQKSDFGGRWIDAAVQQANSRVKPPVPAGKRSYQAGPFWTDNLSLRLTLPRSEYPMQQKIQDRFTAEHGAMLEKTYSSYEAAQTAADQAAKIFAGMAVRTGVTADIDDVFDDDD